MAPSLEQLPPELMLNVLNELDLSSDTHALLAASPVAFNTWKGNPKTALINFLAKNLSDSAIQSGLKILGYVQPAPPAPAADENPDRAPETQSHKSILLTLTKDKLLSLYKLCVRHEPIVEATIDSLRWLRYFDDGRDKKYTTLPRWLRERLVPLLESVNDDPNKLKSRIYSGLFYFEIFIREGGLTSRSSADDWKNWFGASFTGNDQAITTEGLQDLALITWFFWHVRITMPPRIRKIHVQGLEDRPEMVTNLLPTALKSKGLDAKGLRRATVNQAAKL